MKPHSRSADILQPLRNMKRMLKFLLSRDESFLSSDVPRPSMVGHSTYLDHLATAGNLPGKKILEVGSREVTGPSTARARFARADYCGFDCYPGANVDVVGDAHQLSSHVPTNHYDIVFSSACFEHFEQPWIVAAEIAKVLKVGGIVFIETHFSFSSHERPAHFFHFTDLGLKSLFPKQSGINCIDAGMSNPVVARFSAFADPGLRYAKIEGMYCHSEFLGVKARATEAGLMPTLPDQHGRLPVVYPHPAGPTSAGDR
jgi:SAM-dependent methyltransferase